MKKIVSLVLSLLIVLSVFTVFVGAQETTQPVEEVEDVCVDSGDDFYEKDKVVIYKLNGEVYDSEDNCLPDGRVQEITCCDSEDYPGSKNFCAKYLECPNGCNNGACLQPTNNIKIADYWTDKQNYYVGDTVTFSVKVVDSDGTPATPEEGNRVYINLIGPEGSNNEREEIKYDYSSQYYEFTTPAIDSGANSGKWSSYATAENSINSVTSGKLYFSIIKDTLMITNIGKRD